MHITYYLLPSEARYYLLQPEGRITYYLAKRDITYYSQKGELLITERSEKMPREARYEYCLFLIRCQFRQP